MTRSKDIMDHRKKEQRKVMLPLTQRTGTNYRENGERTTSSQVNTHSLFIQDLKLYAA